jgi:hypothetical protein
MPLIELRSWKLRENVLVVDAVVHATAAEAREIMLRRVVKSFIRVVDIFQSFLFSGSCTFVKLPNMTEESKMAQSPRLPVS